MLYFFVTFHSRIYLDRQGILIGVLAMKSIAVIHTTHSFKSEEIGDALQDWLICVEMCLIGVWHHWV